MSTKEFHLNLIQAVIARMGNNSFLIKGWSVTLVSAILAYAADKNKGYLVVLCFVPVLTFWILDAFFVYQEQLFRDLYDATRVLDEGRITFSLNTEPASSKRRWWRSFGNTTLLFFYGGLIATILIVLAFIKYSTPSDNPDATKPNTPQTHQVVASPSTVGEKPTQPNQ